MLAPGRRMHGERLCRLALFAVVLALLRPALVSGHDASAYGGVFRSRNAGGTWLNADIGLFINSALTVAVDPRNPAHLLLGTDTGLLRSQNGGRSWTPEAKDTVLGAVFAAAFAPDGRGAICAAPSGVFRFADGRWERAGTPPGAVPARAVAFGARPGRVYLLGRDGLFTSDDEGRSFLSVRAPPAAGAAVTALAVSIAPEETVFALAGGRLRASLDGGAHWQSRDRGAGSLDAVLLDPAAPGRLWAAGHGALSVSDDLGQHWREAGQLPDRDGAVRGIAADPEAARLIVTTDRGLYRSQDGGRTWQLEEGSLPVHLEAGPLTRDPSDLRTLYAVYSLVPYPEVWRAAVEGSNLLSHLDRVQLAGGVAFMLLLLLSGVTLVRRLARARAVHP
jgi:photosystem II stability/assembly factor-like uncharacterized protein